jgi:hypothetical protein
MIESLEDIVDSIRSPLARCQRACAKPLTRFADSLLASADDASVHDEMGVIFRSRYDAFTLMGCLVPRSRDAAGRKVVLASVLSWHLSPQRRSRLWAARSVIERDMRVAGEKRRRACCVAASVTAVICYGGLLSPLCDHAPSALLWACSVVGLVAVAALPLARFLSPAPSVRRRVSLSHARCACCLSELNRDRSATTSSCGTCHASWFSCEVGVADGRQHCCVSCGYDTTSPAAACPECGCSQARAA